MHELADLRILSARVGSDPLLVQAAGGNTSLKQGGVMWIKASGTWLQYATIKDIFVLAEHGQLMAELKENDTACESCADFVGDDLNATGLCPSIETTVHSLMSRRIVIRQNAKPAVEPMGRCLADVMVRIKAQDVIASLITEEIGQLANWDAGKYRQGICR